MRVLALFSFIVFYTTLHSQNRYELGPWNFHLGTNLDSKPCGYTPRINDLFGPLPMDEDSISINSAITQKDWWFETTFDLGPLPHFDNYILKADGLRTYTEIFVNGGMCGRTQNAFTAVEFNITNLLRPSQQNLIRIHILATEEAARQFSILCNKKPFKLPADNDTSGLSPFVRMPGYEWGWDFAPKRLVEGLGNGVSITGWNYHRIKHFTVTTDSFLGDTVAMVTGRLNLESAGGPGADVFIDFGDGIKAKGLRLHSEAGTTSYQIQHRVRNPRLWWPNGMFQQLGQNKPEMYTAKLVIWDGTDSLHADCDFGMRKIELIQTRDDLGKTSKKGHSFYFNINGKAIYAKGVNIVPSRGLLSEKSHDSLWKKGLILNKVQKANVNMLRIWGGGEYEQDWLYQQCDTLGLLVWQDFMFAGAMYPFYNQDFWNESKNEVCYQVERLSKHPCIALWCGNNEIEVAWQNWGWQNKYKLDGEKQHLLSQSYTSFFHSSLPKYIDSLMSLYNYIPSSPISNWGNESDFDHGDNHYWGVWHGEAPINDFTSHIPRFASEFGFPSYPISGYHRDALGDIDSLSYVKMRRRMLSYKGIGLLDRYLDSVIYDPGRKAEYHNEYTLTVQKSQSLQAQAIYKAIIWQRMNRPFCMGSLVWQLNDVWPGVTWSILDVTGEPKLAFYTMSNCFAPVVAVAEEKGDFVNIHVSNDNWKDKKLVVEVMYERRWIASIKRVKRKKILAKKESAGIVYSISKKKLDKIFQKEGGYLSLNVSADDNIIYRYRYGLPQDLYEGVCLH